jgi:hypothetical protein
MRTLRTTVSQDPQRTSSISKCGRGQPKTISEEEKKRIFEEIKKNPARTMRDLHVSLCPFVAESTLHATVYAEHIRKWKKSKRTLLLEKHAAARLQWVILIF